jgi:hypothetical protein
LVDGVGPVFVALGADGDDVGGDGGRAVEVGHAAAEEGAAGADMAGEHGFGEDAVGVHGEEKEERFSVFSFQQEERSWIVRSLFPEN